MFATKSFLSGAVGEVGNILLLLVLLVQVNILSPARVQLELISFHDIKNLELLPHWRSWEALGLSEIKLDVFI